MQLNIEEMKELTLQQHFMHLALFGDMEDQVLYLERKDSARIQLRGMDWVQEAGISEKESRERTLWYNLGSDCGTGDELMAHLEHEEYLKDSVL